jgi:predicted CxxxxCH...CXXCH cytochrome family protein
MKRVGLWGLGATFVLVCAGSTISFLVLPRVLLHGPRTVYEAFCLALGVPQAAPPGAVVAARTPASQIVLTHDLLPAPAPDDIGHGATLALRCTPCHGPTGISNAESPNLAGQYATTIYKQLRDYRSGARSNAIMTAMAQALSDTDMRQIAAYYASRARSAQAATRGAAPPTVKWGDPMRNVAPCGSCHGGTEHTAASPWLNGEPASYLRGQIYAFASGARTNDINGQMRAMARGLTPAEVDAASAYFAGIAVAP